MLMLLSTWRQRQRQRTYAIFSGSRGFEDIKYHILDQSTGQLYVRQPDQTRTSILELAFLFSCFFWMFGNKSMITNFLTLHNIYTCISHSQCSAFLDLVISKEEPFPPNKHGLMRRCEQYPVLGQHNYKKAKT